MIPLVINPYYIALGIIRIVRFRILPLCGLESCTNSVYAGFGKGLPTQSPMWKIISHLVAIRNIMTAMTDIKVWMHDEKFSSWR